MKKQSILLEIDKSAAPVIAVKGPLREWLHELKVSLRVGKLRRKNCDVYYWDRGKIVYRDKAILIVPEELRDAALEAGYKPWQIYTLPSSESDILFMLKQVSWRKKQGYR
ncbi:hypothetical protein COPRO5265_0720 [Coprothermobacter proteolyticus DSM 5265]|uniref:Uncharacterized protein n=1 Tax=Coprothermobacter proteolyticus (strain ATCC 35245 / DSM 5265 / OCM 4 / BT) TaxID=309798 RepID=B5Y8H1_COPPD|nr:hypothetical protein [Coprothermobacter proteolyticus]ACI17227.1 hypothetical protein COPRO5265_0720 [Coprothermobacter proteolyticus DSM 5265]